MKKVLSAIRSVTAAVETIDVSAVAPLEEMGTSGLRKVQEFWTRDTALKFAQGVADYFATQRDDSGKTAIVIGGDPRENNKERVELIIGVLLANGFDVVTVAEPSGKNPGMASTPALSAMILQENALGGFLVTASHNPKEDAGIKINGPDGGGLLDAPAKEVTRLQNLVKEVRCMPFKFESAWAFEAVALKDPRDAYVTQLNALIDFDFLRTALAERPDFKIAVDAKGGAGGPFVMHILKNVLGLSDDRIVAAGCEPDTQLGGAGVHPEPAVQFMVPFIQMVQKMGIPIGFGLDGDADRRLTFGAGKSGIPAVLDSASEFAMSALAIAEHPDWFKKGIDDVFKSPENPSRMVTLGRSLVTSPAIDHCIGAISDGYRNRGFAGARVLVTPTGFKYINAHCFNWGVEESNGAGVFSNPAAGKGLSEKDGMFHFLLTLTRMLQTGKSLDVLQKEHWQRFGRTNFARGEITDPQGTPDDVAELTRRINLISSKTRDNYAGYGVIGSATPIFTPPGSKDGVNMKTWEFTLGPVDINEDGVEEADARKPTKFYLRFSGTGTGGYTLRAYVHSHVPFDLDHPESIEAAPGLGMKKIQNAIDALLESVPGSKSFRTSDWTFEAEQILGL